jgi:lysyl-tRNA synthetase class 2
LSKALQPLPDKWHGLADTELRYRRRYVDLIMNEASREVFRTRTRILRYLRDYMDTLDFIEVETPMMQPIPGGAAAQPFKTRHNALDLDMYLRIAPELYLKRLIVGGFERVYEINRNFRNEGLSTQHNPEFTMLELYWAYTDYLELMELIERLLHGLADTLFSSRLVTYQGRQYDLGAPFRRVTVEQLILEFNPTLERAHICATYRTCVPPAIVWRFPTRRATAPASCRSRYSRRPPSTRCSSRHSSMPILLKSRRCRVATMPIRFLTDRFEFFLAGREWPMDSRSSTTRKTRLRAFASRWSARTPVTTRRCTTTRTTSARSSTACRRPPVWASAWIAW